jgi:hypothetical protein
MKEKILMYHGDTSLLQAAALDLAEEIGLDRGTIEIDLCRTRGRAVVSIVNRSCERVINRTEKESK